MWCSCFYACTYVTGVLTAAGRLNIVIPVNMEHKVLDKLQVIPWTYDIECNFQCFHIFVGSPLRKYFGMASWICWVHWQMCVIRRRVAICPHLNPILYWIPPCWTLCPIQDSGRKPGVLVHCASGYSRSVGVMVGWLMCRKGYLYAEALEKIRLARPRAFPNAGFQQQLKMLEACKCDITERFVIENLASTSTTTTSSCWELSLPSFIPYCQHFSLREKLEGCNSYRYFIWFAVPC